MQHKSTAASALCSPPISLKRLNMPDKLTYLIDSAIYKEIVSPASHIAVQSQTQDPARALMKELTEEGLEKQGGYQNKVPNLTISEYLLVGSDKLEGTGF